MVKCGNENYIFEFETMKKIKFQMKMKDITDYNLGQ